MAHVIKNRVPLLKIQVIKIDSVLFACLLAISNQEVIETNFGNKHYEFKSVISSSVT